VLLLWALAPVLNRDHDCVRLRKLTHSFPAIHNISLKSFGVEFFNANAVVKVKLSSIRRW
ncbi:MAG: hypothetical protein ACTHM5_12855, partial [Ginsengibacter sp.]